jgi:hypothetical protein
MAVSCKYGDEPVGSGATELSYTEAEKYSSLFRPINLFIFRIYNMG